MSGDKSITYSFQDLLSTGGTTSAAEKKLDLLSIDKNSYILDDDHGDLGLREEMAALDKVLYERRANGYQDEAAEPAMPFVPEADVDFIERGKVVIRVMDKHNFYEAELMPEDYLRDAPVGLLTKLWISISKIAKE